MAISKLIFNGVTQMDVTGTTAQVGDVATGKDFTLVDGTVGTGTLAPANIQSLSVTSNGTYTASGGVTGYSPITVSVSSGLIIPDGMAYYNGYLLPQIPTDRDTGYDYYWIRDNDQNDTYDLVLGNGAWYTKSGTATLDNWALVFANLGSAGSRQYSISRDGTVTSWGTAVTSTSSYYGTNSGRKVIFTSHDIKIASLSGNVILRKGFAIYPPT